MGVKQRYQVVQKLDSGGMAEIFKGKALSLDGIEKSVAIKRILPSLSSNARFVKMFIDEARLSMRLNHANIVQVFDVGRADGTYFLVMELLDGTNVRRLFQKMSETGRSIPPAAVVHIGAEVCKALNHAHEAKDNAGESLGIVHRDVSPPNILLSWTGEVKITDFGLAKAVSQLQRTEPGIVKGKFSYLAPEAADGKTVDARADIFGLGVILHELLTGRRLFMGKNDLETVELVRKCQVPAPSTINKDVPRDLDDIILKALARDRKKRWQSAKEFGDALVSFLFSNNLKFTQYDLASLIKEIHEDVSTQDNYRDRLKEMIREEVLSLSMIGMLANPFPSGRAEPLEPDELDDRKGSLDEIWDDVGSGTKAAAGKGPSFESLVASSSHGAAASRKALILDRTKLWGMGLLLAVAILLGVGTVLYFTGALDGLSEYEPAVFETIKGLFN